MIKWEGTFPKKVAEFANADFDHIFSDFFQRRDLSFPTFKLAWKERNGSRIHYCCPDKCDEKLFLQLMFQFILTRLNCVPQIDSTQTAPPINSDCCEYGTSNSDISNRSSSSSSSSSSDSSSSSSSSSSSGSSGKSVRNHTFVDISAAGQRITRTSPIQEVKWPLAQQAIWNTAVIYSLYCMYSTQTDLKEQVLHWMWFFVIYFILFQ